MLRRILFISAILLMVASPAFAGFKEAQNAFFGKDWNQAITLLRPLAETGDDRAMVLLGHMYARGLGVTQNAKEAFSFYKRAALEKNNTDGMVQIALMSSDQALAKEWFHYAAQLGNGTAAYFYGVIISRIEKNEAAPKPDFYNAYKWFKIAATGNPEHSQYRGAADNLAYLITQSKLKTDEIARANKEIAAWKPLAVAALGSPPAIPPISEAKPVAPKKP